MRNAPRFSSLAMAGAVACAAAGTGCGAAEAEIFPGIFAPKRALEPAPPPLLARRSATSEHVTAMITRQAMARAKEFDPSALPIPPRGLGAEATVLMEKFFVREKKERPNEAEEVVTPMMRFWRTGTWLETAGYRGTLRLLPAPSVGALPKEPVMRVEIAIKKKF